MAIHWEILGAPGADNALLATVDSGQSVHRLLFDCGEGCLQSARPSVIQSIDHLCFSHLHMDHVAGFDTFFRHTYNRETPPIQIWGPGDTLERMAHRFRSFTWNLHEGQPGEWIVHSVEDTAIRSARFHTSEAFEQAHSLPDVPFQNHEVHRTSYFELEAHLLPHHNTPSLGYQLIEKPRVNIDPEALKRSGWQPGPWLQELIDPDTSRDRIEIDGSPHAIEKVRSLLLVTTPGESITYLTDFSVSPGSAEWASLVDWISGTELLVCECQYRHADELLARKNGHMTAKRVGELAAEARVGSLILHHLSRRYSMQEWIEMKQEAAAAFPKVAFSPAWSLD
ncbi:MAG: MBL fold metallo-hydrolase [Verrucomicrobiota bacterium]